MKAKRMFDLLFSVAGICCLIPIFILFMILVKIESDGPIFFTQLRVGLHLQHFKLIKFRTMHVGAEKAGFLTLGDNDKRITRLGIFMRKYKIDELPQLFNILWGDMSFVGPRPEVLKYVEMYDVQQKRVLSIKPGLTDWASIKYMDEIQLLAAAADPESFYIHTIMQDRISQNLDYIDHNNLWIDFKIICCTLKNLVLR